MSLPLATLCVLAALAASPAPAGHPALSTPATPEPAASTAPAPAQTPVPVLVPPQGIYRPLWETVDPHAPTPGPLPSGAPRSLPHYVGLGKRERERAVRLQDLVSLIEGHLEARRLASARVALGRADAHVRAAEDEFLVLGLHAGWTEPRNRLFDLRHKYEGERRGSLDDESRQLAAAAALRVGQRVDALARGLPKLALREAMKRVDEARRAFGEAQQDPFLIDNPAWPIARGPVLARLEKLEREVGVRVGQGQLLEAVLRMDSLARSAHRRLGQADYDGALGDLAALEEACLGFEHDLRELKAKGYDDRTLVWIGTGGELRGQAFLAKVAAWRNEGARRWDVVERARARARIREEEVLRPPDPPPPPRLP